MVMAISPKLDDLGVRFRLPDGSVCADLRLAGITAEDFDETVKVDAEERARRIVQDFIRADREPTNAELDAIEAEQSCEALAFRRLGLRERLARKLEDHALVWVCRLVELVRG